MTSVRRLKVSQLPLVILLLSFASGQAGLAQSAATVTQTVGQRNTIGVVAVSPTSGLVTGSTATFTYTLHTGGAPAPTSETVQFMDGATALGSAQSITSVAGSNLVPYSQVDTGNGWTTSGTAPTVTTNTGNGPDGSSNTASQIVYPDTTTSSSGLVYAVPGTVYANLPMTLSVWAKSTSATTLTLKLTDSPASAASQSSTCAVTSTWQRCTLTYTFPAGAGSGFAVSLISTGQPTQTISLWGAQVEQASAAGPYVSTIGTARPTGGAGGSVTFAYSLLQPGSHTISVVYAGDTNFVGSTSNTLNVTVGKMTPPLTFTGSPSSPLAYGAAITLTAALTTPAGNPGDVPSGTVQFFDGATSLGTETLASGSASLTLSGVSSLTPGTHTITAVYSGDANFTTVTSSALTYVITAATGAVTLTPTSSPNPSVYGDSIVFSITLTGTGVTPTGTVAVTDGGTSLGTITLVNGAGSLTVSTLTAGTHTITFTYSGDSNYN